MANLRKDNELLKQQREAWLTTLCPYKLEKKNQRQINRTQLKFFTIIASLETEIKKLDSIQTKPKKLVAQIAKLNTDIQALAELVDAR